MKNRMTEADWFASNDPFPMLRPCRRIIREHPRKGWLFAVACCCRIWHLLSDQRSRVAVEVAAQYADGLASRDQLREAEEAAEVAHDDAFRAKGKVGASAEWAAQFAASFDAWFAASRASNFAYVAAGDGLQPGPEHTAQAHLLRCVFGPLPFRPVAVARSWLAWNGGTVVKIAQGIYEERQMPGGHLDRTRLAVLADALEEAGCDQPDLLDHLRGPGFHVRGCHLIDLLLNKA